MNSLSKIIASVAVGAVVIAAGSAFALRGADAAWGNFPPVPFAAGFNNAAGCGAGGDVPLSFRDRWNGGWESASNDFTNLVACPSHWARGYLNTPTGGHMTVAQGPSFNLSTLPLMR